MEAVVALASEVAHPARKPWNECIILPDSCGQCIPNVGVKAYCT